VGSAGGTIISGGKGNVYGKLSLYNSEITSAYMWQAMNAAGI
jgi:hypothetical protein